MGSRKSGRRTIVRSDVIWFIVPGTGVVVCTNCQRSTADDLPSAGWRDSS